MSTPETMVVQVERLLVLEDGSIVIQVCGSPQHIVRPGDTWWVGMDAFVCCEADASASLLLPWDAGVRLEMPYREVMEAMRAARGMREAAAIKQVGEPWEGVGASYIPPWTHITADAEANVEVTNSAGRTLKLNQFGLFRVWEAAGYEEAMAGIVLGATDTKRVFLSNEDCRRVVALIKEAIASGEKRHLVRVL